MSLFDFADGGAKKASKALRKGATLAGGYERKGIDMSANSAQKGVNEMLEYLTQARTRYEPYAKTGQMSFQNWQDTVKKMQDPTKFYNDIMSKYTMSPAAQYRLTQGLDTLENEYAAAGRLGGSDIKRGITKLNQDIIGQDQHQFLNDILGINNDYLANSEAGARYGYDATNSMAGIDEQYGQGRKDYNDIDAQRYRDFYNSWANQERTIAEIKAQKARESAAATNQWIGQGIQMGADYLTGGASAVIRPFTSQWQANASRPTNNNYYY